MVVLKKLIIALFIVLFIGISFKTKTVNAYESENEFYEKYGKLIQKNWNENNDAEVDSVNKEFETMRLILKLKKFNLARKLS